MVARRAPCRQGIWAAARTHGPRAAACSKPAPHLLFNTLPRMLLHTIALPQVRASGRKSEAPAPPLPEKCFCRQRHVKEANETGRIHGGGGKTGRPRPCSAQGGPARQSRPPQPRTGQAPPNSRLRPLKAAGPPPAPERKREAQKNCRIRRLINNQGRPLPPCSGAKWAAPQSPPIQGGQQPEPHCRKGQQKKSRTHFPAPPSLLSSLILA